MLRYPFFFFFFPSSFLLHSFSYNFISIWYYSIRAWRKVSFTEQHSSHLATTPTIKITQWTWSHIAMIDFSFSCMMCGIFLIPEIPWLSWWHLEHNQTWFFLPNSIANLFYLCENSITACKSAKKIKVAYLCILLSRLGIPVHFD